MRKKTKIKKTDHIDKLERIIARLTDENRALYSRATYAEARMTKESSAQQPPEAEAVDLSAFDNVVPFRRAS